MAAKIALFATLLPLIHAGVVPKLRSPVLQSRAQVFTDVIRLAKCEHSINRNHDPDGSWEMGVAGWFPSKGQPTGSAAKLVRFDMYHRTDDYFVNGHGTNYGGDFVTGDGKIQVELEGNNLFPNPEHGLWVGYAKRYTKAADGVEQVYTYNCYTESWTEGVRWNEDYFPPEFDPKWDKPYGECRTYVTCVQDDGLTIRVKGTEDITKGESHHLKTTGEILAKFDEVYDEKTGFCDTKPLPITDTGRCTVKFECVNNDVDVSFGGETLKGLKAQMNAFGDERTWSKEVVTSWEQGGCNTCPSRQVDREYMKVPKTIMLAARGRPPKDSGRRGYSIASIKATVSCEIDSLDKMYCEAFKSIFDVLGLAKPFAAIADLGGVATSIGCTLSGAEDEDD